MVHSRVLIGALLAVVLGGAGTTTVFADLVAYYPLDGDLVDATGNGNDGTGYGGFGFGPGAFGSALTLDGSTGYADLTETTQLDGFAAFTFALWIRPANDLNADTGRQDFLYKGAPVQWGASYGLNYDDHNGALGFHVHSTDWFDEVAAVYEAEFPSGQWFHVACTYDGVSEVLMYVNGVPAGTVSGPGMNGALYDNSDALTVGRRTDSQFYFDGDIEDLRLYDHVLTPNEIADLAADCNDNGIPDDLDLANCDGSAWCSDCNENGVPDECDLVGGPVYSNDFEADPSWPEWGAHADHQGITPNGHKFLGPFANETECVTLTIDNLPAHTEASVAFDLFIIDSYDGNAPYYPQYGPDYWGLKHSAEMTTLLWTTFSNCPDSNPQAYPDEYPGGDHPCMTGASQIDTLGYPQYGDTVYSFPNEYTDFTFAHADSTLLLHFCGPPNQGWPDEGWGIDNLVVTVDGGANDCNQNGIPDECELDGNDCNVDGIPDDCQADFDEDGVIDDCDNCPEDLNSAQDDFDGDGAGDVCDDDIDDDGVLNEPDVCDFTPAGTLVDSEGRPVGDLDLDCDADLDDYDLFQQSFTGPLGS